MEKFYSIEELRKFYPRNLIEPSSNADYWLIHPASPFQGREILSVPHTLPIRDATRDIPYDLTEAFNDLDAADLLDAMSFEDYSDLLSLACRFGYFHKTPSGQSILHYALPLEATHIQLIGIRELYGNGWMESESQAKRRLNFISEDRYQITITDSDALIQGWIFRTDFRTENLRKKLQQDRLTKYAAVHF